MLLVFSVNVNFNVNDFSANYLALDTQLIWIEMIISLACGSNQAAHWLSDQLLINLITNWILISQHFSSWNMKEDKVSLINPREMKAKGKVQVHVWGCGCVSHLLSFFSVEIGWTCWAHQLSLPVSSQWSSPWSPLQVWACKVRIQKKKCYAEKHKGDVLQIKNIGYSEMSLPHTDLTDLRIQT